MGLFNPAGKIRTATLKATKDTLVLRLDYKLLSSTTGIDAQNHEEIRDRLWAFSRARTQQNEIYGHSLFSKLPDEERNALANESRFLPTRYNEKVELKPQDLADSWILVLEGILMVTRKDGKRVQFKKGDCIGPEYLYEPLYTDIDASRNTYVIKLSKTIIEGYIQDEKHEPFLTDCLLTAHRNRSKPQINVEAN